MDTSSFTYIFGHWSILRIVSSLLAVVNHVNCYFKIWKTDLRCKSHKKSKWWLFSFLIGKIGPTIQVIIDQNLHNGRPGHAILNTCITLRAWAHRGVLCRAAVWEELTGTSPPVRHPTRYMNPEREGGRIRQACTRNMRGAHKAGMYPTSAHIHP